MSKQKYQPPQGIAAKDIFQDLIYSSQAFLLPEIEPRIKKRPNLVFNREVIDVLNYMYYQMYRNRVKSEFNYQEICHQSYSVIAKWARVSIFIVKDVIHYALKIGLLHAIEQLPKRKHKYCPGTLIYDLYPQNLSTSQNLRCGAPQMNH